MRSAAARADHVEAFDVHAVDEFTRELSELCRKYGLGIGGQPTLFVMENDDSLAAELRRPGALNGTTQRSTPRGGMTTARVPYNAAEVLAESEFNRYYVRGLCRRATANSIPRLEVYRAKHVVEPRPESQAKIGLLVDPEVVLLDVRASIGVEAALGIPPGPGSGISIRIPKS